MRWFIPGLIIILLMLGLSYLSISNLSGNVTDFKSRSSDEETATAVVTKVIDGDTVELNTSDRVRLLGINTEEKGQKCYEEATDRLEELVLGREVKLEKDIEDKGVYGRLLRYVFIDGKNVNILLVREGLASVYIFGESKYSSELEEAETKAKEEQGCIWKKSENCADCIGISYFHSNTEGNDCGNLNDEYVKFKNSCSKSCDMSGWTVKDEGTHIYTFPEFVLEDKSTLTLYTGSGSNSKTELYWDSKGKQCNSVWNNNKDTLYLRDKNGNLVIDYSYEFNGSEMQLDKPPSILIENQKNFCENVICPDSQETCPDGFTVSCSNSCSQRICSQCEPDCSGHEFQEPETCVESWYCSGWNSCYNGQQTRTCSDSNNCGTEKNKSTEIQKCIKSESPPENLPAPQNIVINEIQIGNNEFVELYNPISSDVDMTGWYFSYYSSPRDWNNPYRNKQFPDGSIIRKFDYFLIGLKGFSNSDWQPYTSAQLSNTKGSVAIFPFDPKTKTSNDAKNGRIDAFGYGEVQFVYDDSPKQAPSLGKSLERKSDGSWAESLQDNGTPRSENNV